MTCGFLRAKQALRTYVTSYIKDKEPPGINFFTTLNGYMFFWLKINYYHFLVFNLGNALKYSDRERAEKIFKFTPPFPCAKSLTWLYCNYSCANSKTTVACLYQLKITALNLINNAVCVLIIEKIRLKSVKTKYRKFTISLVQISLQSYES